MIDWFPGVRNSAPTLALPLPAAALVLGWLKLCCRRLFCLCRIPTSVPDASQTQSWVMYAQVSSRSQWNTPQKWQTQASIYNETQLRAWAVFKLPVNLRFTALSCHIHTFLGISDCPAGQPGPPKFLECLSNMKKTCKMKKAMPIVLPQFKGYRVDMRLREFRRCVPSKGLEFMGLDSIKGNLCTRSLNCFTKLSNNTRTEFWRLPSVWFHTP